MTANPELSVTATNLRVIIHDWDWLSRLFPANAARLERAFTRALIAFPQAVVEPSQHALQLVLPRDEGVAEIAQKLALTADSMMARGYNAQSTARLLGLSPAQIAQLDLDGILPSKRVRGSRQGRSYGYALYSIRAILSYAKASSCK